MKSLFVVAVVFLMSFVLMGNAFAQDTIPAEYNQSKTFVERIVVGDNFQSPKISCAELAAHCAFIYTNNETGQVILGFTTNFFTIETFDVGDANEFNMTVAHEQASENLSYPYDIFWDSDDSVYRIVLVRKIFSFDVSTKTLTNTVSLSATTGATMLRIVDQNEAIGLNKTVQPSDDVNIVKVFLNNGTTYQILNNIGGTGASSGSCERVGAFGWIENQTSPRYYVRFYDFDNAAGCDNTEGVQPSTNITVQSVGFTVVNLQVGIDYWESFDGTVIYRNSSSVDCCNTLFFRTSSDLVTFTSEALYYTSNQTVNERILQQDKFQDFNTRFIIYKRLTNSTGLGNGIYISRQATAPILIIPSLQNWNTGVFNPTTITATLRCTAQNYNQTGTGTIVELATPCGNSGDNSIEMQNPANIPSVVNITLDGGALPAQLTTVITAQFVTKSAITFKVIDKFDGSFVSGATVKVGSLTGTTNGNGEVTLNIIPIFNTSFNKVFSSSANKYQLTLNESELLTHVEIVTASGFFNFIDIDVTYPKLLNSKVIPLERAGTTANVHFFTADGQERTPNNVSVFANASTQEQQIFTKFGNIFKNGSVTFELPSTFFFANTTPSSFNATFSILDLNGVYYNTTVNLTTNSTTDINIFSDVLTADTVCNAASDCAASYCSGAFHNKFVGCLNTTGTDKICTYGSDFCENGLCDAPVGCFDVLNGTACIDDSQCQSQCLTQSTSLTGFCTTDGVCGGKEMACVGTLFNDTSAASNVCQETSGVCLATQFCQDLGGAIEPFVIKTGDLSFDFVAIPFLTDPNANLTSWVDTNFLCDDLLAGSSQCIKGATVSSDVVTIVTTPNNWLFSVEGSNFRFWDVAVTCGGGLSCDISKTFCEFGCFEGICLGSPPSTNVQAGKQVQNVFTTFTNLFPSPELLVIGWSVVTLLVMLGISIVIDEGWRIGIISGLIMFVVGIGIGFYPVWLGLVLIVASALTIASKFFSIGGD